jgi:hypothetical protein
MDFDKVKRLKHTLLRIRRHEVSATMALPPEEFGPELDQAMAELAADATPPVTAELWRKIRGR